MKIPDEPHNFDKKFSTEGNAHTIEVDTAAGYGYFERNTTGTGGGLWFEPSVLGAPDGTETPDGRLILTDHDPALGEAKKRAAALGLLQPTDQQDN